MKKLKKAIICFVMTLALLASTVSVRAINSEAAAPFWGAAYCNPGVESVDVKVDVTRSVSRITVKTWDFTGDIVLGIDVYDSNGKAISSMPIMIGANEEKGNISIASTKATGTYTLRCYVISGNAGGWIGAWIY